MTRTRLTVIPYRLGEDDCMALNRPSPAGLRSDDPLDASGVHWT
jgi:hypothetical protein